MAGAVGCAALRRWGRACHLLLFSFMNVHMSLSSGLCAKEQLPTYWHLRPFCAWMQSWEQVGRATESCGLDAGNPPATPTPSAHIVLLWEVADGWQWPHRYPFPLGLGHHQKDPPLLGPAVEERGAAWGELQRKPCPEP